MATSDFKPILDAFAEMEKGLEPAVRDWTDAVEATPGTGLDAYTYALTSLAVSAKRSADALERIANRLDENTDHRYSTPAFAVRGDAP